METFMENKLSKMAITVDGSTVHYLDGNYHNSTSPAIIWPNGATFWYLFNVPHRYYGPAGKVDWYLYGKQVK